MTHPDRVFDKSQCLSERRFAELLRKKKDEYDVLLREKQQSSELSKA